MFRERRFGFIGGVGNTGGREPNESLSARSTILASTAKMKI